jgi:hypothetical protein
MTSDLGMSSANELDFRATFETIRATTASRLSVSDGMQTVIDACARSVPHDDWDRLRAIDYGVHVDDLRAWVKSVLRDEPPAGPIEGLWFGLFNPVAGGQTSFDVRFAGTATYDSSDEDWLWTSKQTYRPSGSAGSRALRDVYRIAYSSPDALGNSAEWPLGLAFVGLAARSILSGAIKSMLGSAPVIGVAVGFDDGDMFKVGELGDDGWNHTSA